MIKTSHSTETALTKDIRDLKIHSDPQRVSVLELLTAAFNIVDETLIQRL